MSDCLMRKFTWKGQLKKGISSDDKENNSLHKSKLKMAVFGIYQNARSLANDCTCIHIAFPLPGKYYLMGISRGKLARYFPSFVLPDADPMLSVIVYNLISLL